jgi:sirohydrochlorin ferrochelatase
MRKDTAAFLLWRAAQAVGWNVTLAEAAEAAGVHRVLAGHVAAQKGWQTRFRVTPKLRSKRDIEPHSVPVVTVREITDIINPRLAADIAAEAEF